MNPMKALGGYGEAGIVVTDEEDIYYRMKRLRHAGTTSDPKKLITNQCLEVSLNHKIDTINAAMLLVSLDHFYQLKSKREKIAKRYDNELPNSITRQAVHPNEVHGRYVYPLNLEQRDELKIFLEGSGIECKIFNQPLACDAPVYKSLNNNPLTVARRMLTKNLIIPSHEKLEDKHVDFVLESIFNFYN